LSFSTGGIRQVDGAVLTQRANNQYVVCDDPNYDRICDGKDTLGGCYCGAHPYQIICADDADGEDCKRHCSCEGEFGGCRRDLTDEQPDKTLIQC
jgi:hypothetical protein